MDGILSRRVKSTLLRLSLMIYACIPSATIAQNIADPEGLNSSRATAAANTALAFDLYQRIAKEPARAGKNFFYSPFSISMGLAMLGRGAHGRTLEQIAAVTHFSDTLADKHPNALEPIHASMSSILQALRPAALQPVKANPDADEWKRPYVLSISNYISLEQAVPIDPAFERTLQKYYGVGQLVRADFAHDPDGQRARINQQTAAQSNQNIGPLPPKSIDQDTLMVLTNVAHFKGGCGLRLTKRIPPNTCFAPVPETRAAICSYL